MSDLQNFSMQIMTLLSSMLLSLSLVMTLALIYVRRHIVSGKSEMPDGYGGVKSMKYMIAMMVFVSVCLLGMAVASVGGTK